MNNAIFDLIEAKMLKSVIVSNEVYNLLSCDDMNYDIEVVKFNDARAAAFYAMGKSQVKKSQGIFTCLIVRAYELTSCYTALTEAFFEKIPLIVFSCERPGEDFDYKSIKATYSTLIDWDKEKVSALLEAYEQLFAPIIIRVQLEDFCNVSFSNSTLGLENFSSSSVPVYYYSLSDDKRLISASNVVARKCHNSYGAVPRYIGNLIGGSNAILVIPESAFIKDVSFFINYNGLGNMVARILVYNCVNIRTYEWLHSQNGINIMEVETIDSELVSMIESSKESTIYLWRGEL